MVYSFLSLWLMVFTSCTPPASKSGLSKVNEAHVGDVTCRRQELIDDAEQNRKECLTAARQNASKELEQFLKVDLPQRKKALSASCDDEQQRVYDVCSGGSRYVRDMCIKARGELEICRSRQKSQTVVLNSIEKSKRERIDLLLRQAIYKCEEVYAAMVATAEQCAN